jgi:hypothetical protein
MTSVIQHGCNGDSSQCCSAVFQIPTWKQVEGGGVLEDLPQDLRQFRPRAAVHRAHKGRALENGSSLLHTIPPPETA